MPLCLQSAVRVIDVFIVTSISIDESWQWVTTREWQLQTRTNVHLRHTSYKCDVAHSYLPRLIHMWHDSFICESRLIHMWHDSFQSRQIWMSPFEFVAHECSMRLFNTAFAQEPSLCWSFLPKKALFIGSLLQDPFEDAHECSMRLFNSAFAHEPYLCWSFLPKRALFTGSLLPGSFEDAHDAALQHCFCTRALSMLVFFAKKSPIYRVTFTGLTRECPRMPNCKRWRIDGHVTHMNPSTPGPAAFLQETYVRGCFLRKRALFIRVSVTKETGQFMKPETQSMRLFNTAFAQEPYLCWSLLPKRALFIGRLLHKRPGNFWSQRLSRCGSSTRTWALWLLRSGACGTWLIHTYDLRAASAAWKATWPLSAKEPCSIQGSLVVHGSLAERALYYKRALYLLHIEACVWLGRKSPVYESCIVGLFCE